MKVTEKDIQKYFKKYQISIYIDFAKKFDISSMWARQVLRDKVVSSINFNGKYITLIEDREFDKFGIIKINKVIFSRHGTIRQTLIYLIKNYDQINSSKIYSILGINPSQQLTILLKNKQIFCKKKGRTFLYSISQFSPEQTKNIEINFQSLDKTDKVLRDLEIIRQIKDGKKKTELAKQFKITPKTISNICKRFEHGQTKALIKSRESKPYKIDNAIQSAIITEMIQYSNKTAKEITESIKKIKNISVKSVETVMSQVKKFVEPQKKLKILLEIQSSKE